ncbi:hypothetical protein AKJ16_DCAP06064 [Drosera capensis]
MSLSTAMRMCETEVEPRPVIGEDIPLATLTGGIMVVGVMVLGKRLKDLQFIQRRLQFSKICDKRTPILLAREYLLVKVEYSEKYSSHSTDFILIQRPDLLRLFGDDLGTLFVERKCEEEQLREASAQTRANSTIPIDIAEHSESRRKWKIKCGKALFALRTSISREFIDHVRDVNSPKEVWETLERVFTKKNTARL